MTDEECIALATLHGCLFADFNRDNEDAPEVKSRFFVHGWSGEIHPLEQLQFEATKQYGWDTREELARDYCEYYGLLDEVTP